MPKFDNYRPEDWGDEDIVKKFTLQRDDAKLYFTSYIKPRLDRAYKLYIGYTGDRAKEIKNWQANIFVPYTHGVVETLMPRILDARPEFTVQGRNEDDQMKSNKVQKLCDFNWEIAGMDATNELITRSALIYGSGFMQVSWKKDVRTQKFLVTKDLATKKKLTWEDKTKIFYDAPYAEWVDNYSLWYDWHNIPRESKQYWFKRLILSGSEIKRRYPLADKNRLELALKTMGGDLTDYASIRNEVKLSHDKINKGSDRIGSTGMSGQDIFSTTADVDLKMHEVFEWLRPFDDDYAVVVNNVPVLKDGSIPNPYDFKETFFIDIPYLKMPNEFEGYGLPLIMESPQIMINMIKNQRLDATTLNIHKMWIVNPLANIDKSELVTRPFGIIYSTDPTGVREVEFSDVKASAYREEELLKGDMRYASGVDDFSMGVGGGASSATEVRHLRESTLERVRLFINHIGDGYSELMRYWISMYRQFFTKDMIIRITGDDGQIKFPLIEEDDLKGEFDFRAAVLPSIAGKNDIDKKQGMDLFQLLINLPFVDPKKLTSKVLHSWNWNLDSVVKAEEGVPGGTPGLPGPGVPGPGGLPPELMAMMGGQQPGGDGAQIEEPGPGLPALNGSGDIPMSVIQAAISGVPAEAGVQLPQGMSEASSPINLLQNSGGLPPTVPGPAVGGTTNPRGMNRGGKVNTNIPMGNNSTPEGSVANQAANIQR